MSSRSSVDRAPTRCSGGHGFDSCFSFVPRSCHPTLFPGSLFSAREAEKRDWERRFRVMLFGSANIVPGLFFLRFQSRVHNSASFRVLYNFSGILRTFINGNLVLIHNLANHSSKPINMINLCTLIQAKILNDLHVMVAPTGRSQCSGAQIQPIN